MFISIRKQLISILLLFGFITIFVSVVIFSYYEKNKDSLYEITKQAEKTHFLLIKDLTIMHEFIENETINPAFFEYGKSRLVSMHDSICILLKANLKELYALQRKHEFRLDSRLNRLQYNVEKYTSLSSEIIRNVLIRGFKDYGIEGEMRSHAHKLELYKNEMGLNNILQLRRHEKDFIIRQELPYVSMHDSLVKFIKEEVSHNKKISSTKQNEILKILGDYQVKFQSLVFYDKKLGLKTSSGLKHDIDYISHAIESSLAQTVMFSEANEKEAIHIIRRIYLVISLLFALSAILSALFISKRVSRSITDLTEKIDEFVKSDFSIRTVLPITKSVNEVDVLITNFSIMEQHIVDQMKSLRQSNKDLEMLFHITSTDIKPPLLKVKELTSQAFVRSTDPQVRESFYQIGLSWDKLLNITDELGIVTNIRTAEIKTEIIDLNALINSTFSEFRSRSENIIFSVDIRMANDFFSSKVLVKAIFRNLIDNSIKYSSPRSELSFIKILISDQNEEMLRIEVEDNGIGIQKDHLDAIFNMFFRGTTKGAGTGLGLYVVKCSIEKLHGAISVESDENKGTIFTLLLPNNYRRKNIKEKIIHNRKILEISAVNQTT
ncbi:hypothetical protein CNR22_22840 [Sphingobacteriaceae bacterium]|nr:hypothetical protein CNR22_22840 [Sphingobacteriaceae bacterium]